MSTDLDRPAYNQQNVFSDYQERAKAEAETLETLRKMRDEDTPPLSSQSRQTIVGGISGAGNRHIVERAKAIPAPENTEPLDAQIDTFTGISNGVLATRKIYCQGPWKKLEDLP